MLCRKLVRGDVHWWDNGEGYRELLLWNNAEAGSQEEVFGISKIHPENNTWSCIQTEMDRWESVFPGGFWPLQVYACDADWYFEKVSRWEWDRHDPGVYTRQAGWQPRLHGALCFWASDDHGAKRGRGSSPQMVWHQGWPYSDPQRAAHGEEGGSSVETVLRDRGAYENLEGS